MLPPDSGWTSRRGFHRRPVVVALAVVAAGAFVAAPLWLAQTRSAPPAPIVDDPLPIDDPAIDEDGSTPPPVQTAAALGTDQPCTRALRAGSAPVPVPFRAEDLPRMVPAQEDLGPALAGFESDLIRHGYHHNAELSTIEVHPPDLCEDLERFGRMIGFGNGYETYEARPRRVLTAVHLFWDEEGAAGWAEAFVDATRWEVGTPEGPSRFQVELLPELGPAAWMVQHDGPEGTRTWAILQHGPVVGWVVDLHPGSAPTVDVLDAARVMGTRIEQVTTEATGRSRDGLDIAQLMSVPLPLAELGEPYAGLAWNDFWGGCTDLDEWAMIVDDTAVERARKFGVTGLCTGMYGPDGGSEGRHLQIWTRISVLPDSASADAFLTSQVGGQSFEVSELSVDEAYGWVLPPGQEGDPWGTRVKLRRDRYVLEVGLNEDTGRDARAELVTIAARLDARLTALLAGAAPG